MNLTDIIATTRPRIAARLAYLGCTVTWKTDDWTGTTTLTANFGGRSHPEGWDAHDTILGVLEREFDITRYAVEVKNVGMPYTPEPITDPSWLDTSR